jgi:hypothetical protein
METDCTASLMLSGSYILFKHQQNKHNLFYIFTNIPVKLARRHYHSFNGTQLLSYFHSYPLLLLDTKNLSARPRTVCTISVITCVMKWCISLISTFLLI